jgi:alpha-tubulin suppressor-like RCC1 family protein
VDLANMTAIAAGGNFSAALSDERKIVFWGAQDHGQRDIPSEVSAIAIRCRGINGIGLSTEGALFCWGLNNYGQRMAPENITVMGMVVLL